MHNPAMEEVFESLEDLGELRSRSMFGGHGLYCDDVFFGLWADELLYFKVDAENRPAYLALGAAPFLFGVDQPTEKQLSESSYYEVPLEVQERPAEFLLWAQAALEAARRKQAKKQPRAKKSAKPKDPGLLPVRRLRNLGPTSCAWLRQVEIRTRADLEREGSLGAYAMLLEQGVPPNLNLLYALEAALMDLQIVHLPTVIKASLRERSLVLARRKKA